MITNVDGWIQSGYWTVWSGGQQVREFAVQDNICGGCVPNTHFYTSGTLVGPITLGNTYSFRVIRFSGDGLVREEACVVGTNNCDVFGQTSWDPQQLGWIMQAQDFGSTKNTQSDVPGTQASPAAFKNMQTNRGSWSGDTWNTPHHDISRYHAVWVTTNAKMQIWTI
jgi:hypothetical protein